MKKLYGSGRAQLRQQCDVVSFRFLFSSTFPSFSASTFFLRSFSSAMCFIVLYCNNFGGACFCICLLRFVGILDQRFDRILLGICKKLSLSLSFSIFLYCISQKSVGVCFFILISTNRSLFVLVTSYEMRIIMKIIYT